jgi:EpsI family protein
VTKLAVVVGFLALNAYIFHFLGGEETIPPRESFASFPLELADWRCSQREKMPAEIEERLGVTDYLLCSYLQRDGTGLAGLYVGYNATQVRHGAAGRAQASIHPPRHCLPGSGWDIVGSRKQSLELPGLPEKPAWVNRLVIAKGDSRQLVYYWYQSRGRVIADDWKKIVHLFWDRATRRRSDGSLVRFTVPILLGDEEGAEVAFQRFASLVVSRLPAYLPE